MTLDETFGQNYDKFRVAGAVDERDEYVNVCRKCGQVRVDCHCNGTCQEPDCECCREAREIELRATMHLNNVLALVNKAMGL